MILRSSSTAQRIAMQDNLEARTQLWELIKDTRFAMFTTRHHNGHLHSRPMTTQNQRVDEDDSLWFFMSRKSEPVDDLQADQTVNVAYANPDRDSYVSVSGTARLVDESTRKQQLWSKPAEAYFSGPDDPDLALVQVRITHADFWDVKESKLVQLYEMAKAVVTGKRPVDLGDRGVVRMN
jgi:general stress protein 26